MSCCYGQSTRKKISTNKKERQRVFQVCQTGMNEAQVFNVKKNPLELCTTHGGITIATANNDGSLENETRWITDEMWTRAFILGYQWAFSKTKRNIHEQRRFEIAILFFFLNIYIFRFVLFFVWLNQNESTNTPDDCDPWGATRFQTQTDGSWKSGKKKRAECTTHRERRRRRPASVSLFPL